MGDQPNIFIAGFGRCGTTAMMQLLWAGGAPVAGLPPAFEDTRLSRTSTDLDWVNAQRGKVTKWIDPRHSRLPSGIKAKTIWMDRKLRDQARSQMKLIQLLGDGRQASRTDIRAMESSLRRDRAPTLASLRKRGPVIRIKFHDLLMSPLTTALFVQRFLGNDLLPDPLAGAQAILKRGPECQPDMWIEQSASMAWDMKGAAHG